MVGRAGVRRGWLIVLLAAACWGGDDDGGNGTGGEGGPGGGPGGGDDESGSSGPSECPGAPANVGAPIVPVLAAPVASEVDADPAVVRVGDLTGDGLDDIAILEMSETGVFVVPADGAGGVGPIVDLTQPFATGVPRGLEVADLDGDGHDDLVVGYQIVDTSQPGVQRVWWGGPGFPGEPTVLGGDGLYNAAAPVAAGDFDGDGHVDLAGSAAIGTFVSWGLGGRAFAPGALLHPGDLTTLVMNVRATDIDADGRVEPIADSALGAGYTAFRVYHVAPDRSVSIGELPSFPFPGATARFTDLDLDGAPELMLPGAAGIYVAWNQGNGDFDLYDADWYCTTGDPITPATSPVYGIADLDADGELDVAAIEGGDLVFMYGRAGDRHLREHGRLPAETYGGLAVLTGEFDGDGRPDLAVLHDHTGSADGTFPLLVYLNETP